MKGWDGMTANSCIVLNGDTLTSGRVADNPVRSKLEISAEPAIHADCWGDQWPGRDPAQKREVRASLKPWRALTYRCIRVCRRKTTVRPPARTRRAKVLTPGRGPIVFQTPGCHQMLVPRC